MNPNQSLYRTLADTASRHPENAALHLMGKSLSYREFLTQVERVASGLSARGIRQGDVLTLCMPNVFDCLFVFYAANKIGAVCHMVHPMTPAKQMERFLTETDSHFLFVLDSFHAVFEPLLGAGNLTLVLCSPVDGLSVVKRIGYRILNRKKLSGVRRHPSLLKFSAFQKAGAPVPEAPRDPKADSMLLHSGGTSGKPKTIALSDFAVNSLAMKADFILEEEDLRDKKMLAVLPMFHGFGLCMGVHGLLCFGGCDVLMPKFSAKETIGLLKKNQLNFIIGVPTLFENLLSNPEFAGPHLKNLRRAYVGGDFVSPTLKEQFDRTVANHGSESRLLEGYGLTEVVTVCAVNRLSDYRPDSVGRPLPGIKVKIVGLSTREELPLGTSGEIAVAGDTRMNGYFRDPETTASTFWKGPDGDTYVLTGDYGRMGEAGHLYFQQRMKRIVKVSGMPVMPSEIETLVTAIPGVAEAAAIGVDDFERGHMIKLFIRMKPGDFPRPEESTLRKKIKEEISPYAVPKSVEFLGEMPHTLIGKVDIPALEAREREAKNGK